jgi:uncharacterized protein YggE
MHTRTNRLLAVALAAGLALGCVGIMPTTAIASQATTCGPASETRVGRSTPVISASGTATLSRAPDQAMTWLGVQTTGKTALEAIDKLNRSADTITKAIRGTQAPGLIVQTQALSLQPQYRREGEGRRLEAPEIVGYIASTSISATTTDITKIGAVIDAGLAAGANQMNGLSFTLKNQADAKREALANAAIDARSKAEAVAGALGMRLGPIVEVQTDNAEVRPFVRRSMMAEAMFAPAADMAVAPTNVEAGQVDVSANVTVVYSLISG